MKKTVALILSVLLLFSVFAVYSSATTKADLLALAKKSAVYKYIKPGIENAYNTVTVTDAQAEQLKPLIEEFNKIVPESLGPTAADWRGDGKSYYSLEQIQAVYRLIYKACDIMSWRLDIHLKTTDSTHKGDYVFYIYDTNNRLIFEYDGDLITNTSGDAVSSMTSANTYLICGSVLAAASVALFMAFRKKEENA